MTLKINEIFYSIQGESSYAGKPCIFVRLSECNLRCAYCDTQYAYLIGRDMELEEIIDSVSDYHCSLIEITGGEPLLQRETPDLIRRLLDIGYRVLLETNGSMDISTVDERCIRIMDVKCPSSGEKDANDLENLNRLREKDELKFVIGDRADYEYAKDIINMLKDIAPWPATIHLSPSFGRIDNMELARWILEDGLDVRFHIQLHKIIWGTYDRGV
jgi:7-carboxy-7-deazaguanine synthase